MNNLDQLDKPTLIKIIRELWAAVDNISVGGACTAQTMHNTATQAQAKVSEMIKEYER